MTASVGTSGGGAGTGTAGPALAADALRVDFRARGRGVARAVDGVDLDVGAGEIVALVGESGCGKSTLARALLGLVRPTAGEVRWRGRPLTYRSAALKAYRRQVQLVLQDPSGALNPRHTVYEAVAEGLRIHGRYGAEEGGGAEEGAGLRTGAGRTAGTAGRGRIATSAPWSPRRWPVPGCVPPSGSSSATRTSSPAASGSGW